MIKLRFTNSIEIKIEEANPALIVDSLNAVGFKDIGITGDLIEFKSDIKDQNVESFQRRYGNGKVSFKTEGESMIITAITETKQNFRTSLLLTMVLIAALIYFGVSSDKNIQDLLILGIALIISFVLEYLIESSLIRHKQKGLLNLINEKIKIASH